MNGGCLAEDGKAKLGGFYAYKNTFNEQNVWVDVPKNVTFLNITDPYNMEASPEPEVHPTSNPIIIPQLEERPPDNYFNVTYDQAPGLEALSTAATSDYQYTRPLSLPSHSPGDTNTSSHASNNLNFILNPVGSDGSIGMYLAWLVVACCGPLQPLTELFLQACPCPQLTLP
jgi:hypothetical protein